jgi:large subunit ribosomal protein L29
MAKKTELKELSIAELELKIREAQDELVHLRLRKQTGQVEHPHRLKELRKQIARLNTYLNQKQKAATAAA